MSKLLFQRILKVDRRFILLWICGFSVFWVWYKNSWYVLRAGPGQEGNISAMFELLRPDKDIPAVLNQLQVLNQVKFIR